MNHAEDAQFDRTIEQMQSAIAQLEPSTETPTDTHLLECLTPLPFTPPINLAEVRAGLAEKRKLRAIAVSRYGDRRSHGKTA